MQVKIKNVDLLAKSMVEVLAERKESKLLPQVSEALKQIDAQKKSQNSGVLWSANPLNETMMNKICTTMKSYLHRDIELKNKIDNKLMGGFKIELGDWVLDASLKADFDNLQKALTN